MPATALKQPSSVQFGYGGGIGIGGFGGIGGSVQETGEHEANASSVKEYAYQEDKNYRCRPAMEDSKCHFLSLLC
jgi:hypothetical protein